VWLNAFAVAVVTLPHWRKFPSFWSHLSLSFESLVSFNINKIYWELSTVYSAEWVWKCCGSGRRNLLTERKRETNEEDPVRTKVAPI
jgi:hypothetical protein